MVLWIYGIAQCGKTTLAHRLKELLLSQEIQVEHLDGDVLRNLFPQMGFSREERDLFNRRVGYLASYLESNGVIVLASLVSPTRKPKIHSGLCKNFVEIYVSTPLQVTEKRERRQRNCMPQARKNEIAQFTGVSDVYEPPSHPENHAGHLSAHPRPMHCRNHEVPKTENLEKTFRYWIKSMHSDSR
jgi:adenylylsulfate kinase